MERFGDDERILCWDMCNEPFSYPVDDFELLEYVKPIETEWLRRIYENCKKFGATQALGIGYTLYALYNSQFPDLHYEDEGPLSPEIGNLCFISRDASLREGHGIVNNYQNQPADAEK